MIKRIISTFVLLSTISSVLYYGGIVGGVILLIICALLAQWELYTLFEKMSWYPNKYLGIISGALVMIASFYETALFGSVSTILEFSTFILVIYSLFFIMKYTPQDLTTVFIPTIFGYLYIPFLLSIPILWIRNTIFLAGTTYPMIMIIWLILVTKFSDIGGLLIGKYFGKHKIAPQFSPKKTVEGLCGSLAFSTFIGLIISLITQNHWPQSLSKISMIKIIFILSVVSLISDLIESAIKRIANVKDSGGIIPGIGGFLDLIDSLLFTLPLGVILLQKFL